MLKIFLLYLYKLSLYIILCYNRVITFSIFSLSSPKNKMLYGKQDVGWLRKMLMVLWDVVPLRQISHHNFGQNLFMIAIIR